MYRGPLGMYEAGGNSEFGSYGYQPSQDPDDILAGITYQQYMDYVKDFQPFEKEMLQRATTDTSLIDQARVRAPQVVEQQQRIAERNRSRYGVELTPAQLRGEQRAGQRQTQLQTSGAINQATLQQRDINRQLLSDLTNIGQGLNRSSLGELSNAASNQHAREQAYKNAKAQHKQQTIGAVGSLGAAAIMFLAF